MELQEIFAKIRTHMLEGLVFHDEMSRYYDFLGLKGYCKCHLYHYAEENIGYKKLSFYFMAHYNKFIPIGDMKRPDVIPSNWYSATRFDVDKGTLRSGVETGMQKWVDWEEKTMALYKDMYKALMDAGEVSAARTVGRYLEDVENELLHAKNKKLFLDRSNYDLSTIMGEQEGLCEKYMNKLKQLAE